MNKDPIRENPEWTNNPALIHKTKKSIIDFFLTSLLEYNCFTLLC